MNKWVPLLALAALALPGRAPAIEATNPAVRAVEEMHERARPLPLTAVRLTGGPLKHAQDLTAQYLLSLEPDRMMAGYRIRAGLEPKAPGYGGWDAVDSRQLTGHIAGHYLSGVSILYASTGDPRFKERADYLVNEMKEVQDKRGTGYLGAIINNQGEDGERIFEAVSRGDIRSGGFDLNGLWSPWYTLHKTFAGLRDAYRLTGNRTALEVEIKFAAWAEKILAPLSPAQIQQMLNTEFGGMNEVMADLYADTGDRRWLELSYKFEHERIIRPLSRHQDILGGIHGNTTIPKLIGSADRFAYTGSAADVIAAAFFWDAVVQHHTFATGGNSTVENFPPADQLANFMSGRTNETCNVYNMLKLTRRLFALNPDAHYADFLERATFNHMLAAIDPQTGETCYMVPVGGGGREYDNHANSGFTCCAGSGMESQGLHADGLYFEMGNKLWITTFAPSTVDWAAQGAKLEVATEFPEGDSATIRLTLAQPKELTLAIRRPVWAGPGFAILVNNEPVPLAEAVAPGPRRGRAGAAGDAATTPGLRRGRGAAPAGAGARGQRGARGGQTFMPSSTFVEVTRTWRTGDTVEIRLPKTLRLEPTPDDPTRVAILWGPLVLAPDTTTLPDRGAGAGERRGRGRGRGGQAGLAMPILVADATALNEWLQPVAGQPGVFTARGVLRRPDNPQAAADVTFAPFYRLHRQPSFAYVDLLSNEQWTTRLANLEAERRQQRLEEATLGFADAGEMQAERDYNYQSSESRPVEEMGVRHGRAGTGWFSFDLPVNPSGPTALLITFHGQTQANASFEVLVDGTRVATQSILNPSATDFYDAEVAIPANLTQGKERVTVRFQATGSGRIPTVYGLRTIRADAPR